MTSTGIDASIRAYVLTICQEGHPRFDSAVDQLRSTGLSYEFVSNAEFSDRDTSVLYSGLLNKLLLKRSMSRGEIACYAGHRRMWKVFVDSGARHALFLEDDFGFIDRDAALTAISDALSVADRWDVVKLFDYNSHTFGHTSKYAVHSRIFGSTRLVAYRFATSGSVAYLMNREAAMSLLKRRKIYRPVDEDMVHMWEFGIRILSVDPNPVTEISAVLGGSNIDAERSDEALHRKNILRSIWWNVLRANKSIRSSNYMRKLRF
jgi:glycosyl transferase, family 25